MNTEHLVDSLLAELKGYVSDAQAKSAEAQAGIQQTVQALGDAVTALQAELAAVQAKLLDGSLKGADGRDGEPGPAGDKGDAGERGEPGASALPPTGEEIRSHVRELLVGFPEIVGEEVKARLAENPPASGKDGRDGKDGTSVSLDDIKGLVEAHSARWQLDFERRAQETIQRAIDKMPVPRDGQHGRDGRDGKDGKAGVDGVNGKDGADFSDVTFDYDGQRSLIIRGKGGEIVKPLPIPLDAGYYRDGMAAAKGDIVTHDGNAWIALRPTKSKPSHEAKEDWRLFARKGRDGRDGANGRDLGPAPPVKLSESGNA